MTDESKKGDWKTAFYLMGKVCVEVDEANARVRDLTGERDEARLVRDMYIKNICDLFEMGVSEAPLSDIKVRLDGLRREAKGRIHAEIVADGLRDIVERLSAHNEELTKIGVSREKELGEADAKIERLNLAGRNLLGACLCDGPRAMKARHEFERQLAGMRGA